MDQPALDAISPLIDRYCDEFGRFTVPFFKRKGDAVEQYGSGVLLRVADAHFVATARHVVDEALPQETWPYMEASPVSIGVGPSAPSGIPTSGHGVRRLDEPYDQALIELSPSDVTAFNQEKRFLELGACDLRPLDIGDLYAVIGYPSVDSTQDPEAREVTAMLHGYFARPYAGDRGEIPTGNYFNPEINVAFDHVPSDYRNYEGGPTGFPRPGGASGCGIWKLNVAGLPSAAWDPSRARLVAIFQSVNCGTKTTIGTPIGYLISLLRQHRPDLNAVIDLTFPSR